MKAANKGKDLILPLIAIGLSLWELVGNYHYQQLFDNILSLIVSLLGLVAGALYFAKHRWFLPLLHVWIIAQFPAISQTIATTTPEGTFYQVKPWFDAGQGFPIRVGLTLGGGGSELNIKINVVPFVLLILYRLLRTSSLIGSSVVINRFSQQDDLGHLTFPIKGKIVRSAALGKEKDWLMVEAEQSLTHAGTSFKHLLVRDKEGAFYKPGNAGRVSYLIMVPQAEMVSEGPNRKELFTFLGWGLVQVLK